MGQLVRPSFMIVKSTTHSNPRTLKLLITTAENGIHVQTASTDSIGKQALLHYLEFVDLAQKQLIFARIAKMMVLVSSVWNLTLLRMTELNVSSLSQTVLSVRVSTLQMEYLGFVLSVFRDITSTQ